MEKADAGARDAFSAPVSEQVGDLIVHGERRVKSAFGDHAAQTTFRDGEFVGGFFEGEGPRGGSDRDETLY